MHKPLIYYKTDMVAAILLGMYDHLYITKHAYRHFCITMAVVTAEKKRNQINLFGMKIIKSTILKRVLCTASKMPVNSVL